MVKRDDVIAKLTNEDIKDIMASLGADEYYEEYEGDLLVALRFQTICHGGNSHKLYYYTDNKIFHCYTDCQDSYSVFDLVMKVKHLDFYDSLKYILSVTGHNFRVKKEGFQSQQSLSGDWDILDKYMRIYKKQPKATLPIYNENILNLFNPSAPHQWQNEYISKEIMRMYNIRYAVNRERIIIPHYNIDGQLVGIRGRALKEIDIEQGRKYMPIRIGDTTYKHQTRYNLYGLNFNKDTIAKVKKVMLVESEKAVMQTATYYNEDNFTVATSGSNITEAQFDLLLSLGVNEVLIAFDKEYQTDSELEEYLEKIYKKTKKYLNFVTIYVIIDTEGLLKYKDSPTDKGREVLEQLMSAKIELKRKDE